MKKRAERILSYFMMIVMFVFLFSGVNITNVSADERFSTENGYLYYRIEDNNEITIIDYFGTDEELNIPSKINGKSVTSIGEEAFYECSNLINITIPNSVTSIEDYAFWNCWRLTSITLPSTITNIGYKAFMYCSGLISITIPDSVTSIEDYAFRYCSGLISITIPNSVTSIGSGAFEECSSLTNITIPNSVTSIQNNAFNGCSSLTNITIPNSVTSIQDYAFGDCSSLTSIIIPNSVTNIGYSAFIGCSSLTNITIPNSVTNIGLSAFMGCSSLTNIIIPNSVTSIGDRAFWACSSLKSITISNKVTSIGEMTFGYCSSLKSIIIPNLVTSIGDSAFEGCSSLTSITIPNSVTNIGLSAFKDCSSLTNITIPNLVTNIGSGTFGGCSSLTNITIPNSVTNIEYSAFLACSSLTSIIIPNSVTNIGSSAFSYCDSLTIYGYKNSYAETYAKENSIPFKAIDEIYLSNSNNISLKVLDEESKVPVQGAAIQYIGKNTITDSNGIASIGISNEYGTEVYVSKEGYKTAKVDLSDSFGKMKTVMLLKTSGVSEEVTSNIFNNISLPSEKLKGPEIEIRGKNFNLFETDINLSLNLSDGLQVENDMKEKKIRVMLGMEKSGSFEIKEDENDKSYWRESYYEMKDFVKSFGGKVDNTKLWNKFSKIRGKLKKYDMNLGFGCGGSFTGYAEFSYETGRLVLVEGGAVLNANANLSLNYPFGGICYATFKIQGDIDAGLRLVLEESKGININGEVGLTLIPTFTVGAGIGKVANIDANLEGKLNGMFKFPAKSLKDSFSASLTGSFYITADFLGMEVVKREKTEVSFPNLELYPNFGNVTKVSSLSLDDNDFEVVSRDYLKEGTSYTLKGVDNEVYKDSFIKENVYPYGEPQIVTLSNNQKLMVWIDDDEERTNENKTKLVYSLYSNNSWSTPKAVYDDKTADYSPRIAKDGDNVYVIWQNANKVFEVGADTDEILKSSNISYSKFNGTGFSEQININDISNTKIELMHDISANNGEVSILWVENSSDDIFMMEGKNSIYRRTIKDGVLGSKELLASNIGTILDLDSSYINNKNFVSYSADKDGDISTNGDSEIFIIEDNLISQITDNNVDDTKLQFEGDNLYWNSNGTLKMINVLDKSNIKETGFSGNLNDFTILENGTNKFITYIEKDEGKSEVVASYYNNGEWSDIVSIINYGKYIRKASTVLDNNGQVVMALNVFETDNTGSNQKTDLVVAEAYNNFDLISDEFLTYDESEVKAGNNITLSTNVKNNSLKDVSKLRAKLMDNDNNVLGSYDILEDIKAGETKEISVSYTLPQNLKNLNIKLLIESMEYEESNLDNNISKTSFSYSDLSFESSSINKNTGKISTIIKNNGYDKADNIKVTLYKDSILGEKIETISINALDINESKEVNFNIPEKYLLFENSYTNKNFHLEIETSSPEIFTYNNGIDLKIEPTKISEIKLNKNNITLNIGGSEKLSAEVFPTDATDKSIIWLSNNIDVATVDNDGNIKGISEGKAEITAISADGETKSTCYVEVKGQSLSPVISSFIASKQSPQASGTQVTLTAKATGTGTLQYKFLIQDASGNWGVLRDYETSNTFTWTTG
ncbi:MAG: leucine-rich repeat protein, partial [Clostridium sp.]|nr:leucine-rich repeat protein [Clostridium sp.]